MTLLRVSGNTQLVRAQAVIENYWLMPGRPADVPAGIPVPVDRRGELRPGEDVEVFAGIDVEIEHLGEWSASASLTQVVPRVPQQETVPLLKRAVHAEPTGSLPDGTMFALRSRVRQQVRNRTGGSVIETSETIYARITATRPTSLQTLLDHVTTVRQLVGLAVRREVGILSAQLRLADLSTTSEYPLAQEADELPLPLRILFLPVGDRSAAVIESDRMLFTLTQLPFDELLPRWAQVARDLRGTVASLVAAHDTKALLEPRLVGAVTAAENLFERTHRGRGMRRMSKADFTRLREVVLAAVGDHPDLQQYVDFVRESLSNQLTLRERLHMLVDGLGEHAIDLLCGAHEANNVNPGLTGDLDSDQPSPPSERQEAQAWAWAAAKGRNEIAHEGLTKTLGLTAALTTLETTVALVELLVLRKLGMSEALLADLVRTRHHSLPRRVREQLEPPFQQAQTAATRTRVPTSPAEFSTNPSDQLDEKNASTG